MNNTFTPLDMKTANELGGALQRIAELNAKKILEQGAAAERRALEAYLSTALIAHAPELLACWFTIENEYRPLLSVMASIFGHVGQIVSRRDAVAVNHQQPAAVAPPNVIQLTPEAKS